MPRLNVIFFNYTFFASALTSNVMQTHTQRVTRVALASAFCGMVRWCFGKCAKDSIGIEFTKFLANENPLA